MKPKVKAIINPEWVKLSPKADIHFMFSPYAFRLLEINKEFNPPMQPINKHAPETGAQVERVSEGKHSPARGQSAIKGHRP